MTTVRISVGQQVAQEVAAIRAALAARGYAMRKQPRRAVWTIQVSPDKAYQLTYQPSPIDSWVLHPQERSATRRQLLRVIQSTFQLNHHRSCR